MNILENPFYLLDASLADDRRTIMSKVQDASLIGDPDECTKAGSLLTNHKNRVKCEVFYLPDLSPMEAQTKIEELKSDPNDLIESILSEKNYTLSNGNLIVSALLSSEYIASFETYKYAIKALSNVLETQDPETVFALINEMRLQSGFSQLADISLVSDALNDLKAYYLQTIKDLFKRLSFDDINSIMSELVLKETTVNTNCSDFISSIVDYYEVLAQPHLNDAEQDVKDLITLFNDLFKYKYILRHEEFDLPDFKETSRFFNNIALFTIKTSDNAISWASKEVSNKLSSWISTALPILVVNKSNGVFYKPCDALVAFCLYHLTELFGIYTTKIAVVNIKKILVNMVEVFVKPLYIDDLRTKDIQEIIDVLDKNLPSIAKTDFCFANFSFYKTKGLFFKKVLTINFDYFQFQSSRYSWNQLFDLDKSMTLNLLSTPVLMNEVAKGKIQPFFSADLFITFGAITTLSATMTLAIDIIHGKQLCLVSEDDEQIAFCDSGLIVEGKSYKWSDIHIKVDDDDDKLFLETDSSCYTIGANSDPNFSQYILYKTFEFHQNRGSLNNPLSLSEKLFRYALNIKWDIIEQIVNLYNGGVYSFPIKVK